MVKQGAFEESISLTSAKTVVVKGGYDSEYSQQTAATTFIQGVGQTTIQATGGSLKFQMLSILPQGSYSLVINITGSGQVHVSPSGAAFQPGTVVTLTAEANLGSAFTGWGGACSGTELTTQLTMNGHKEVSASFSAASTVPLKNQALLGPLAGASIQAYTLDDLSNPIEGPFPANNSVNMQAAGSFNLTLGGIVDDAWVLVSAGGGWDIDANDDGTVGANPVRNQGTLYALAQAALWRQGSLKLNALTDMAWRYSKAWVGQASIAELEKRLNQVARTFLVKKITGAGEIDYTDLLSFNPGNAAHRACLSFDYADILTSGGYAAKMHAGAGDTEVDTALGAIFGSVLSFVLPDDLESEVQVRLAGFGRGKVESGDGLLVVDSEADASAQKTMALYARDRETPVIFTATPLSDTKILGWTGCDQVNDDQTQCTVGLSNNRQVQVNFGYDEAVIDPEFVDLSLATVTWSGDTLTVVVDEHDTDLLAAMADIAVGWYVAGMSDQGPFLLQVTEVSGRQDRTWTLKTIQASLEDVILQGTGTLQRALTHGDLAADAYQRTRSATGELLPVRLVPSEDPDERVFRLQVGGVPDPDGKDRISGDLIFEMTNDEGDSVEIRLHGEVDVTIDLDTGLTYGLIKGLEYFKFVPKVKVVPAMSLTCSGKISTDLLDKLIHTFHFGSIKFMAGPVPVWVTPEVEIRLKVEASVEAELSMGMSYTMTARSGVQYTVDEGWEPIKGFDRTWEFDKPEFHAGGSVKGYVSAEPALMVYSLTGPGLAIEPYLEGSVTEGLDPNCVVALDWGLWAGITGKLQWKGNNKIPVIGKALDKLNLSFEFYNWEIKILGGVLNACGAEPPALKLTGTDIDETVVSGAGGNLQTAYTLTNKGNQDMPWSILKPAWSPILVMPSEGTLNPGASTQVSVTVNSPGGLNVGTHTYRLEFNNEFQGAIGQSGLGSEDRNVRVTVVIPDFPAPTLTTASRYTETTARLQWTYPADAYYLLEGFNIWYTTDASMTTGWVKAATVDRTQYSTTVQGLPKQTVYVTVEAFGMDPAVQTALSVYKSVPPLGDTPPTWTNSLGMTFILLPAGTFTMGSPSDEPGRYSNEGPQHQVTLTQSFYMQQTEVTQAQWEAVMGSNPSFFSTCSTCPVEEVSWNDVQSFITKMNARGEGTYGLPTEAQWEYGARAGSTTAFYNGAITELSCGYDPNLNAIGWYCYNAKSKTHPAAGKVPNAWGLYDMSGNVWEWCQDWYGSYGSAAVSDPTGPVSGSNRVIRGGCSYYARYCRSAARSSHGPVFRSYGMGFRLVLSSGQQ